MNLRIECLNDMTEEEFQIPELVFYQLITENGKDALKQ